MNIYSHVLLITGSRTWDNLGQMKRTFQNIWNNWGPAHITKPLLLSGNCPQGADKMAEDLWRTAGFPIMGFPADWNTYGKRAGIVRNENMVNQLKLFREQGSQVHCVAFLELCNKINCSQSYNQQLQPVRSGHYSHGTIHCRSLVIRNNIPLSDNIHNT